MIQIVERGRRCALGSRVQDSGGEITEDQSRMEYDSQHHSKPRTAARRELNSF